MYTVIIFTAELSCYLWSYSRNNSTFNDTKFHETVSETTTS